MVRRRSTVRFRNGAPAQRDISNTGFQDQVTNQVMRLQLTAGAAQRIQTPVPLWLAAIRLNATASDETARHCQEKVRIRPLPVSVGRSRAPDQSLPTIAEGVVTRCHGVRQTHGWDASPPVRVLAEMAVRDSKTPSGAGDRGHVPLLRDRDQPWGNPALGAAVEAA